MLVKEKSQSHTATSVLTQLKKGVLKMECKKCGQPGEHEYTLLVTNVTESGPAGAIVERRYSVASEHNGHLCTACVVAGLRQMRTFMFLGSLFSCCVFGFLLFVVSTVIGGFPAVVIWILSTLVAGTGIATVVFLVFARRPITTLSEQQVHQVAIDYRLAGKVRNGQEVHTPEFMNSRR